MSNNQLVPLFGNQNTSQGRTVSRGTARAMKQEVELVGARAEIAAVTEQAHAFLTSQALTNVATLVTQADAHMQIAPGGAQFYEAIISAYAVGAGQRITRL